MQVCKTLYIIELFAFHALSGSAHIGRSENPRSAAKKLEGGHVARLMHDERGLFQPELDGSAVGVGIEDIAETRRSHIHFRRHCPDAGILLHRRLYGFDNVFKCGDCHTSPFILFVPPYSGGMELFIYLLTLRGPVWRVRILSGGPSAGSATARGLPDARGRGPALRGRVSAGTKSEHADSHADRKQDVTQHDSPLRVRWECWGWLEATDRA